MLATTPLLGACAFAVCPARIVANATMRAIRVLSAAVKGGMATSPRGGGTSQPPTPDKARSPRKRGHDFQKYFLAVYRPVHQPEQPTSLAARLSGISAFDRAATQAGSRRRHRELHKPGQQRIGWEGTREADGTTNVRV